MSDVNIQTFSGKVNVSNNFTVGGGHLFVDTQNNKVGLNTNTPEANLHVTGNTYISTDISVGGTLTMGTVTVEALHSLEAVTSVGNTTPHTVEFTNTDTSLVASGNVQANYFIGNGSELSNISLQQVTDAGNTTSNTLLLTNTDTSLVASGNVEVGTANLFVDTVSGRVGIGTTNPMTSRLHIAKHYAPSGDDTTHFDPQVFITGESGTGGHRISAIGFSGDSGGDTHQRMVGGSIFYTGFTGNYGMTGYLGLAVADPSTGVSDQYGITEGELVSQTRLVINNSGNVGIATTTPRTTLHVTNETDTTGTGDAFISGLTGNTNNRKPTECLRLQGKWYSPGSGALLRFTNQHPQGTFPNTGEYNLAGIAGYDHDNSWGGGLAFYTSPGTGAGGDDLTLRMSIDSTGHVNIPGPTTGANHGPASMLYLLDTGFFKEFSYTNSETPNVKITFNSTSEIPTGAKAVLAEVFLSRDSLSGNGDHQIHVMGKNHTANQQNWLGGAGQPSPTFGNGVDTRQTVEILMPGESDGFTHYFGNWHSSVIIPLENNQIYYSNYGNSSSTGWVYVKIRGYYI